MTHRKRVTLAYCNWFGIAFASQEMGAACAEEVKGAISAAFQTDFSVSVVLSRSRLDHGVPSSSYVRTSLGQVPRPHAKSAA